MTATHDGVIYPVACRGAATAPDVDEVIDQLATERRAHAATRTDVAVARLRGHDYRLGYINLSRAYREQEVRLERALRLVGALALLVLALLFVAGLGWAGVR